MKLFYNFKPYLSGRFFYFKRLKQNVTTGFEERCVTIKTCGNLYEKWRNERRFSNLPEGDLLFKVPYIDTLPNLEEKSTPIVLTLHGAPGSWKDFEGLASHFTNHGIRVVSPSFPDFHSYKPWVFHHTDEERAQYIKDFLNALSITNVDLLVCHSVSVYAGLQLVLSTTPVIKSIALLNTSSYNYKRIRVLKHFKYIQFLIKLSVNPICLKLYEMFGSFILKNIIRTTVRFESVLGPLLSATAMINGNIPQSKEKFLKLVEKGVPILFLFSDNDPLIGKVASYDLAELFGAKFSDIFIYDKDCNQVQEGLDKPGLKVIAFQEGSHYVFWKYPQKVNEIVLDFFKSVKNRNV